MKLITERGTFDSMAELRGAYITSGVDMQLDPKHAGQAEWTTSTLHISELGLCPRMQMFRLRGAEKKVKNSLTEAMDQLMWWMGNRVGFLTIEALDWAGILHSYEQPLYDPPWSGRYDALFYPDYHSDLIMGFDQKTTRPKAYSHAHSFPKEQHVLQVSGYGLKTPHIDTWLLEYVFFGSTKPPVECLVSPKDYEGEVLERMAELERMTQEKDLPPTLKESVNGHYRKRNNKDEKYLNRISVDVSWECSYCDYLHTYPPRHERDDFPPIRPSSPCKPAWHEPRDLAKNTGGKWSYFTDSEAERDMVEAFIDSLPSVVPLIGGQDDAA